MAQPMFKLEAPAAPESVRVLRSVASAAAAEAALPYDAIEDLSLAIDEASGSLLDIGSGGTLICEVTEAESGLAVEVSVSPSRESPAQWPVADWHESLGALVLIAIASDVNFVISHGRPAIAFRIG